MRIAVCTKYDILGILALNRLLPMLDGHEIKLFFSTKTRDAENIVPELGLMKLLERDILTEIVFPLAETSSRMAAPAATPLALARRTGAPPVFLADLKPDGDRPKLLAFAPDLVISVRFSLIFPRSVIAEIPLGLLNVHPGPLPTYRGLYAPFWQMLNGETTVGCTVHLIDKGLDTGDIIAIERVPVTPGRSMFWHAQQLYFAGVDRVGATVRLATAGEKIIGEHQDHAAARQFSFPTEAEFARFRQAGHHLITSADYIAALAAFVPPTAPG